MQYHINPNQLSPHLETARQDSKRALDIWHHPPIPEKGFRAKEVI